MERVYTNYTASGRQVVLNNVPSSFAPITVENIRLIFNETQKNEKGEALDPLAGTGCKENILSVTYNGTAKTVTIVLANTVPAIASTDKLTIKIDMGDGLENMGSAIIEIDTSLLALESTTAKDATVAKEAQATLNKQAVLNAITAAQAALKGSDDTATLTAIKTLINTLAQSIPSVANIQDGLAKESQTKDGNDTTIGMLKNQTYGLEAIKNAFGNINFSTLAKQQNLLALADVVGNAPVGSAKASVFAYLSAIWDSIEGQHSEDLPEGLADRIGLLLNFFGITQATEYVALTPAEVIASSRAEQYNTMGDEWPIPSWLPDGVTEQDVEDAAEDLGITYYPPTQV